MLMDVVNSLAEPSFETHAPAPALLLSRRVWIAIIMLGFAGQLAWGVENQFFNTPPRAKVNKQF